MTLTPRAGDLEFLPNAVFVYENTTKSTPFTVSVSPSAKSGEIPITVHAIGANAGKEGESPGRFITVLKGLQVK